MPGVHAHPKTHKPKDTKKTLGRILSYLRAYRLPFLAAILLMLVSSGASIAGTYFLKPLINSYIVPFIGKGSVDLTPFITMIAMMGLIYLAGVGATYLYNRLIVVIASNMLKTIRLDLFHHMEDLPISYFDTHTHGEVMSCYTNDIDAMREMLSMGIPQLVVSGITVLGTFLMMLVLSPILTGLVVVMLAIMFLSIKILGNRSAKYFKAQQKETGHVNGYIEEMMEGQKVVKVFCHEDKVKEEFAGINDQLCQAATNAHTFANVLMPVMGNLSYMHYAMTAAVGGLLAVMGRIDLGTIASFLQYTRSFAQPITQVSQQFNAILTALAGAERIFAVIDEPVEVDDGQVTLVNACKKEDGTIEECDGCTGTWAWKQPDGSYTELHGDVRFENVSFGYEPGELVLKDLSLFAKPGQTIAFVGSTGAGKTTITNLLNRFYEINAGQILYDGIDIKKMKKAALRKSLAMVLQDTHLFTGTIRENIRYGNLTATDEDVEQAAKLAGAYSFIRHLPQGYDTMLTADGANLSQGQRQLLAIARAAVADPPVLILDEATSSIDTRTEALINRGMNHLMIGRTVFVIAHRLSTVRGANAIMVLEHGQIIERGDHDELMAQKGKYYQLYTGMFELT